MKFRPLSGVVAVTALAAGVAAAQSSVAATAGVNLGNPAAAVSANLAGIPDAAYLHNPNDVLMSSPTPADQAYRLRAGGPNVISNSPVPDTPKDRRLYGGPRSHGGRLTAPTGD
jgi:hypothetical protein